jgi:hypothetical protein
VRSTRKSLWDLTTPRRRATQRRFIRWTADHYLLRPMDQCRIRSPQSKAKSLHERNRGVHRHLMDTDLLAAHLFFFLLCFCFALLSVDSILFSIRFKFCVCGLGLWRWGISVFEEKLVESEVQGTMYSAGTQMGLVLTPKPSTSETLRLEAAGWVAEDAHSYSNGAHSVFDRYQTQSR